MSKWILAWLIAAGIILVFKTAFGADVPISGLPAASSVTGSDVVPIVQSGTTKKASFTVQKGLWDTFYQPLDGDLTALAALTGTNTIYYRSAASTWSAVTIGTGLSFSTGTLSTTGSAPSDAHFLTSQAESGLSNEVNLGALTTGLLKITVASSIATPSTATGGTDYANLAFKTYSVSGQSDIVADSAADTFTFAAGTGITLTTNAGTDTLTITNSAGGVAGSDTQIQFNDGGSAFGADSDFTWNKTSNALFVNGTIELGAATDTTLARSSAGHVSVEGSVVGLASDTLSLFTTSTSNTIGVGHIELGAASDTTVDRNAAGIIQVEGVAVPTISSTHTLTNKRITPRVTTITSSATPTINTDNCDAVTITALATAITSMTSNLSGTPNNFDRLIIRFKDDGTGRAITWGASFASSQATLPTTTVASKVLTVGLIWDSVQSKWICLATDQAP